MVDLKNTPSAELYDALDRIDATVQRAVGRQERMHTRAWARAERKRVRAELKRRGLPTTRPGDTRAYGPGQASWQRVGGGR